LDNLPHFGMMYAPRDVKNMVLGEVFSHSKRKLLQILSGGGKPYFSKIPETICGRGESDKGIR